VKPEVHLGVVGMSPFQNMGFDPIAMVTALVAIYVACREVSRNNTVILNIRECSNVGTTNMGENNNRPFHQLSLLMRNVGIPLHSPEITLTFTGRDGFGRMQVRLQKRSDRTGDHDELSRGMVAEFGFKSYELDQAARRMLMGLEDPAAQNACLLVFSQGYWAKQFRVGGTRDRLASKWNSLAFRLNRLFWRRVVTSKGKTGMKTFDLFPVARSLDSPIMGFIDSIRREHKDLHTSSDPQLVRT
jgi:hypothetical protein